MEKEKIDKIFQKSRKYISKLGIIIILVSGTSNFLSCSMSLLNKTPEFICENKTNISYKIEKCEPKYFCNLTKEIKYTINKKDSLDNFALKFDLYCEREKYIDNFNHHIISEQWLVHLFLHQLQIQLEEKKHLNF